MNFWKGKKVLVTGGEGFVGSHLLDKLIEERAIVTSTFHKSIENLKDLSLGARLIRGDLKDYKFCKRVTKNKDVVISLAAIVGGVHYNSKHPASLFRDNLQPYINVLEASRENNVERFLTVSSACIYPRDASVPTKEKEGFDGWPEKTNEGYGMSKRMQEYLAKKYNEEYGMKIAIARPYNTYGPRDKFDPSVSHVIPALIKRVVDGENPLMPWGSGNQTRSFIYISDFIEGLMLTTEKYACADPLNIGTSEEVTIRYLVENIIDIVGTDTKLEFDTSKPEGQPRRTCDTTKAYEKIGFEAKIPLREGLEKTIGWYLKNERKI
ncbi:MAG: NAD-dependent epimerase/dehydratase family protein [archaeon]